MTWRDAHDDDDDEAGDESGDESGDADGAGDPEAPDESDRDDPDEPDFIACPECGRSIAEDAQRCHHCGSYVIQDGVASRRLPLWIIVAAVLAGLGVLMWLF